MASEVQVFAPNTKVWVYLLIYRKKDIIAA